MGRQIHVALATNDNYVKYLAVVICSILINLSLEHDLFVYVLCSSLTEENKGNLKGLKNIRNFNLQYVDASCCEYEIFKPTGIEHLTVESYARFKLPEVLSGLDRCIYLDCDIVVRSDLSKLWNINLEGKSFGAVEQPSENISLRNSRLGIPEGFSYFNSGVLLMDLHKLRGVGLEKKALKYLKDHGNQKNGDQDVLNALFYDDWKALPLKWNVITLMYLLKNLGVYLNHGKEEVWESLKNPAIVHYTQAKKPDSFLCEHPLQNEYWKYLRKTSWSGEKMKDMCLRNILKKNIFFIKQKIKAMPQIFWFFRKIKRRITNYCMD